jgi:hypothetical protein
MKSPDTTKTITEKFRGPLEVFSTTVLIYLICEGSIAMKMEQRLP